MRARIGSGPAPIGSAEDPSTVSELLPLVFDELHVLAQAYLRRTPSVHTLQPTALIHEAYLRLVRRHPTAWKGRTHFLAVAARAMRQVLVDYARQKGRKKRWGGLIRLDPDTAPASFRGYSENILTMHEALDKLAKKDPQKARIVELRFFGGLTVEEVAELLGCSKRTVEKEWTFIRAWLRRELCQERM
jgi:RNA polymerase sigma-70 factor, ECF subfamily